jgi:hypothetical protein
MVLIRVRFLGFGMLLRMSWSVVFVWWRRFISLLRGLLLKPPILGCVLLGRRFRVGAVRVKVTPRFLGVVLVAVVVVTLNHSSLTLRGLLLP